MAVHAHDHARTTRWGRRMTVVAATASLAISAVAAMPIASRPSFSANTAAPSAFSGAKWGDPEADLLSKDAYGKNQAERDPGSLFSVEKSIGARQVWAKKDKSGLQVTGQGVAVALLDSGVNQVAGLDGSGKIVYGPDLSIEGNGSLAQQDSYGHGTFMAGIIAGRGASNRSSDLPSAPANVQLGVAPDAKVLAMKLATADGSTDVSQVIAALDWVTQHPVLADGTRVRVINLSYGTDSTQPYGSDPLAAAAENAWTHGIVVVTSAGNTGSTTGRLTDPAIDPYVLAVGATDSNDRLDGWTHDHTKVASFSNVGTAARPVDVVAPGTSLVSTRNRGSYVDTNYPGGLVSGDTSGNLFRGSGTSQAAAVVAGSVALLLQAYPALTPDQVKYVLTATADTVNNAPVTAAGAGTINLPKALDSASHMVGTDRAAATLRSAADQSYAQSTGQGSIDAARGGSTIVDADGNDVVGEVDAQGNAWDAAAWWQASSTLTTWFGGQWLGAAWTGDTWQPGDLSSARWSSARWSSARWSDADWSSARWSSARWSSARWSSARWSADDWG
jgi:serine protease AprX